ncbi:MAG: hypothetical protein DME75_11550, partial [Verrucomicrobia bacterium]
MRSLGWRALNQVSAEDFQRWRAAQNKAPKTLNEYLDAISGLWNWLRQRSTTFPDSPFRGVKRCETRGKEKRVRRAFTVGELKRLLAVAGEGRAVYLMAATTGIRRAELEGLTWSDLALDASIPYVLVRASTSKNKKDKALPLHVDIISALQKVRSAKSGASDLVFEGRHFPKMRRFKSDLCAAGIEYIDASGRRADFHALRHTFATYLNAQGVSPCAAMELMRHSEMRLTTKVYTDANLLGLAEAIKRLPQLSESAPVDAPDFGPSRDLTEQGGTRVHVGSNAQTIDYERRRVNQGHSGTNSENAEMAPAV